MKLIDEDSEYYYYLDIFENNQIKIRQNKSTGAIYFDADDVMKLLGKEVSFEEFLSSDEGLDFINDWNTNHPEIPFFEGAVKRMK